MLCFKGLTELALTVRGIISLSLFSCQVPDQIIP